MITIQVIVSRCGDHVTLGELVLVKDWKYVPPANSKELCVSIIISLQ